MRAVTLAAVTLIAIVMIALSLEPTPADAGQSLRLQRIGNFNSPLYITQAPGGPLMVVEQPGQIKVKTPTGWRNFLDISGRISCCGEQGLLGLAFHPNYRKNRRFYVNFTDRQGDTRVVEFKRSRENRFRALRGSARRVLFVNQPYSNHNGGHMAFDRNRLLYIATGDGGSGGDPENRAQNNRSLLGKILRINPLPRAGRPYRVPRSNPYVGRRGRDVIFSKGLRNPWRFSLDFLRSQTRIIIGDVGQDQWEEISYERLEVARGGNFGWSRYEGFSVYNSSRRAPNHLKPIKVYSSSAGSNCSVTGGYTIRGRGSGLESLRGRYVYGDFCAGQIRSFRPTLRGAEGDRSTGLHVDALSSFGRDRRGRIYAVSLSGPVYRIVD